MSATPKPSNANHAGTDAGASVAVGAASGGDAAEAAAAPAARAEPGTWGRHRGKLGALLSFAVFALALWALDRSIGAYTYSEVVDEFRRLGPSQLGLSVLLTTLSYLLLTVFDWQGAHLAGRRIAWPTLLLTSFIANAFGQNLGLAAVTGGAVRLRGYGAAGMTAGEIAHVIASASLGFMIGALLLLGLALSLRPDRAAHALHLDPLLLQVLGFACLGLLVLGALMLLLGRRELRFGRFVLSLPSLPQGLLQLGVSAVELLAAGGALYAVLPPGAEVTFLGFMGIWTIAILAGLISTVPGGLGVFEATMLLLMPQVPPHALLGAVLAYRAIYFLLPLLAAVALLIGRALLAESSRLRRGASRLRAWTEPLIVPAFSTAVFVAGGLLLATGSIPFGEARRDLVANVVPLGLLEASHLTGSAIGVLLLVLARGLVQRLDAAWAITVVALTAAALTSLIAGFHWELALLLACIGAPLAMARRRFYRPASLFDETFSWTWLRDIALVLTGAIWLGFFAQRHVEYADQLWWEFATDSDAPRMLRASLAAVLLLIGLGLYKLLRPVVPPSSVASAAELGAVAQVLAHAPESIGNLALVGDKQVLHSITGSGFLMYQRSGRSLIAMCDPIGAPEARRELLWRFRELADQQALRPVFYEVAAEGLADYVDLGLMLTKLGEEALVPLASFSLEGRERGELRTVRRKAAREGATFEVLAPGAIAPWLPELARVSDEWLATRETAEKGFSVGYFDPEYLQRFPLALVRRESRALAFANLWPSGDRGELSLDLMRYGDDAPAGVMDFLITEVLLWAQAQGYREFSLGMAPLAGLSRHRLAPSTHKVGDFIWRHGGAFYHFEGLRRFKQKFQPRWRARYLASPGGLNLPLALWDVARLIAGGTRAVFRR